MESKTTHSPSTANTPLSSLLGKKIVFIVVIVSIGVTLFTTLIQLYFEYNRVQQAIESRHIEIRDIHAKLMATSLWNVDLAMLEQRMDSLVNLPYIDYLLITSDQDKFESGTQPTTNKISHQYPLIFEDTLSGQSETLAMLTVETDTNVLLQRLAEIFITELSLNLIKIMLVCYVILLIFHFSINKRIFNIMDYLKRYSPQYETIPLKLTNAPYITADDDELAILARETNKLTHKLTGFYRDITAEKERLSDFTQVSSDWLWETDDNLNLIYCSDPMKQALNLKSQDHKSLIECLAITPNQSPLAYHLKQKNSFTHCEEKIVIGNQDHFLLFQAKARFQGGQFIGFRGTAIHVTELKRAQFELELLNRNLEITVHKRTQDLENSLFQLKQIQTQLVESAKLAALGGLVAGVAHEVNTPLGIAVTATSVIDDSINELNDAFKAQTLTSVQFSEIMENLTTGKDLLTSNLNKAANLIKDFKQTAVDQSTEERETFYISTILNALLTSIHPKTRAVGVTPKIEGDDTLTMTSFPGVLTQIISNLILNSTIHAFEHQSHPEISIRYYQDKNKIVFDYRDNGCGVSDSLHQKIFEPFYTTKRGQGGTGLGLNLVFNLIHQKLHGTLEFNSVPNQGVNFIISLPKDLNDSV